MSRTTIKKIKAKDECKISARPSKITIWDIDGNIKRIIIPESDNLIVTAGKNKLGDLMINVSTSFLDRMKLGSSNQGELISDASVITELTPATFLTSDSTTRLRTGNIITVSVFVPTTTYTRPTATVKEIGLFFSDNTLYARKVLAVGDQFALASGDTARVDYDITIS